MSVTSDERKEQIEKLENFIVHTRTKISSIISALGWSIESVSKDAESIVACPFNDTHRIPERSVEKHLEDCQWKAEGYAKEDLPLSTPSLPPGAASSIKFDEQLQDSVIRHASHQNLTMTIGSGRRLIPRTSERLVADFTRDERCAMYEYVIANTVQPDIGEDIADMNKPKAQGDGARSSYLELLAQERNLKRRRAKYRGVHTNKKSQVEILREIISQQMEMLGEYIAEKNDEPSLCSTNSLPNEDRSCDRSREIHKRDKSMRKDYLDKRISTPGDSNGRQWWSRDKRKSEDRDTREGSSNDRGSDRRNNVSRDRDRRNNESRERKEYSRECSREDSRGEKSHKSSHRSHGGHKSKDRHGERHKRHRSRDREKSRSSRDSRHDERRTKKQRRSRD